MREARPVVEEEGAKVPAYIVTFSDMVTLLLTFFVMLLTLADAQDPELFNKGRDSFIESLKYVGLGALIGRSPSLPRLGHEKDKYHVPESDESVDNRTLDAEEEQTRRLFERLKRAASTVSLRSRAKRIDFSVANVHFAPSGAALNESAMKFLTGFCRDLQQNVGGEPIELYVLGLAADAKSGREQWILSAKRSQAVADFLRDALFPISGSAAESGASSDRSGWFICPLGAGPGGDWVGRNGPISGQSHILIGVRRYSR